MFWLNLHFLDILGRFFFVTTVSSNIILHYTVTLLNSKIFLISWAKFSYFLIIFFSASGRLWVKGSAISITSAVLFSLSMSTISDLLKSTFSSVMIHHLQHKIVLGSGLYLSHEGPFLSSSLYFMAFLGELLLPVGCVSRGKQILIVMGTCSIVSLTYSHFLHLSVTFIIIIIIIIKSTTEFIANHKQVQFRAQHAYYLSPKCHVTIFEGQKTKRHFVVQGD